MMCYKCDRCGALYEKAPEAINVKITNSFGKTVFFKVATPVNVGHDNYVDLCPTCLGEYAEWLETPSLITDRTVFNLKSEIEEAKEPIDPVDHMFRFDPVKSAYPKEGDKFDIFWAIKLLSEGYSVRNTKWHEGEYIKFDCYLFELSDEEGTTFDTNSGCGWSVVNCVAGTMWEYYDTNKNVNKEEK
jgi:hypothetical protein